MSTPSIAVAQAILKARLPGLETVFGLSADGPRPPADLPIYRTGTPGFTTARQVAECADQQGGITVFISRGSLFIADAGREHVPTAEVQVLTRAQPTFIPGYKQFT